MKQSLKFPVYRLPGALARGEANKIFYHLCQNQTHREMEAESHGSQSFILILILNFCAA